MKALDDLVEKHGEGGRWLFRMLSHDLLRHIASTYGAEAMPQDTIYRRGGDLFHSACLTGALKEDADEVNTASLEEDDVCGACNEPVKAAEGVEDLDEAEEVSDGEVEKA